MDLSLASVAVGLLAFAAMLRIIPHYLAPATLAVDHWFWKSYIETYRRTSKFPPVLSQYVLDEHQWYPPLFPLIMAIFPGVVFNRYSFALSIGIDLCRMGLLLGAIVWLAGSTPAAVVMTGLLYATTPILISYNTQLNPRGLGALFLDGLCLLLMWIIVFDGPLWVWGLVLFLAAMILLVHKMTTQLFWFLCLAGSLALQDWRLIALIPGSIVSALVLSGGFYGKVMKAHWDIVSFWHRNWRWLQAHLLKESPIYGEPGYETPLKFHRKGLKGFVRHVRYLFGFYPAAWILAALAMRTGGSGEAVSAWMEGVLLATLIFTLVTVFVPLFKCLGSGYYYLYNAAFPSALAAGLLSTGQHLWPWVLPACVAVNMVAVTAYYYDVYARSTGSDHSFEAVIAYLKTLPKGIVWCLPFQSAEVVAYQTEHPVLWGAHGYGFRQLEPLFPRLMLSAEEVIRRYGVRYIVARQDYLPEAFLKTVPHCRTLSLQGYQVFHADI